MRLPFDGRLRSLYKPIQFTYGKNFISLILANSNFRYRRHICLIIYPDDNNALSIGCLGWHATRAHDLVKNMLVRDPQTVENHLAGSSMLGELSQTNYVWQYRILTSSEASIMRGLLATDVSKTVQDSTAEEDISVYLVYGRNRG